MELKHKSTAAIILAAGGSKRLGKPKQLLDWFGKPFINRVVDTALSAQLTPVIVVTGSNHDLIEKNLRGNEIEIVFNANWQAGQSTSLIAGVKELQKFKVPQFLFLLVDMPQVTEKWLIEILSHAEIDDSDIITTTVNGEVTPPILFKENCFKRILTIEGDSGAKWLVKEFRTKYLEHDDKGMALDCDTEEDYSKLIDFYFNARSQ